MPSGHPIPTQLTIAPPGLGERFAAKLHSKIVFGHVVLLTPGDGWVTVQYEHRKGLFVIRLEKAWKVAEVKRAH